MHGFENRGHLVRRGRFIAYGRFGRMFPYLRSLPAFAPGPEELGRPGGAMDGGPAPDESQDNRAIKAGYTFLGQFVDHDITFDPVSVLERQIDPEATENFRTPVLELDSLYGRGPLQQPYLYDRTKPFRFLIDKIKDDDGCVLGHDLPRNRQGRALIGDPRNDENIIIAQLHLLFLQFHNRVYDRLADRFDGDSMARFAAAQESVRWHYQWIVRHEFLPRIVGGDAIDAAMARPLAFYGGEPFIPVEFSIGAYRFGHSQVRPGYLISAPGAEERRVARLFPSQPDAAPDAGANPATGIVGDLRGGRPVPRSHLIDWAAFFGRDAQPSKKIDEKLSSPLLTLPVSVIDAGERSLATRNLRRGLDARLPAGQTVAAHLQIAPLDEAEIWDGVAGGNGLAPLWYYVLREAAVRNGSARLAGVGAAIVAQVFAALLCADKASYLVRDPGWVPDLGPVKGRFTLADLVNFTLGEPRLEQEVDATDTMPRAAE